LRGGSNAYLALAVESIICLYTENAGCRPASLWRPSSRGGLRLGRCGKPVYCRVPRSSRPLLTPAQVLQIERELTVCCASACAQGCAVLWLPCNACLDGALGCFAGGRVPLQAMVASLKRKVGSRAVDGGADKRRPEAVKQKKRKVKVVA
jgi:hypothetical protein